MRKFEATNGDVKGNWKNINYILGKTTSNRSSTFKINNEYVTDPQVISNTFNEYYATVGQDTSNSLPQTEKHFTEYLPERNQTNFVWNRVTLPEVKRIIKTSKNSKPGPDELPIKIFKNNIETLSPILVHLFNMSLDQGIFPTVHKTGKIFPLYKSKEMEDIKNYRPVCLLNTVGKLLEKIVSSRMISYLEENNILINNQFAYRKGKSTEIAIIEYVKKVIESLNENKYVISVFLDLTRAFDCVNHEILLAKLKHYGLTGQALNWFRTYLTDRKQFVSFVSIV